MVPNIQNTVWSSVQGGGDLIGGDEAADAVRKNLVALFPVKASGKQLRTPAKSKTDSIVKYIPIARANNISIMLTQFRGKHMELNETIMEGHNFSLEQLGVLLQLIPTEEEHKIMSNLNVDPAELSEPERFLAMLSGIPRLKDKVQAMIFMKQFDSWVQEFQEGVDAILQACERVHSSQEIQTLFGVSLQVGNILHMGTSRYGAKGIKLESMMKMRDLKVTKKAGEAKGGEGEEENLGRVRHFLDYIVYLCWKERGLDAQSLSKSLGKVVAKATGYKQSDLLHLMKNLNAGLSIVSKEIECKKRAGECAWLEDFYARATGVKREAEKSADAALNAVSSMNVYLAQDKNADSDETFGLLWNFICCVESSWKHVTDL